VIPVNAGKEQVKRDSKGRFPKGVSGNPNGQPKGKRIHAFLEIEKAIEDFKEKNGMGYWEAATLIAMKLAKENGNTTLLCKIMDKFIPSIIEGTGENGEFKVQVEISDENKVTQEPGNRISEYLEI
jgi:hypothetical protein